MRYKLGAEGYISAVSFGCYLDNCTEYTGTVPLGYSSLHEWAEYACIQAYYIDSDGNLTLDIERQIMCKAKEAQEAIDNAPLIRKDLYETEEILENQFLRKTASGEVIVLEDIKPYAPKLKITGIRPYDYTKLSVITQGKNMMPCDASDTTVEGVTFTKNASGSITVKGTATGDIEYTVSGGTSKLLFAMKAGHDYYLNLGDLQCELKFFDGETTSQQYIGPSGLINLPQSIEVSEVLLKIASGETVDATFFPQLEYGSFFTFYEAHKSRVLEIDFAEYIEPDLTVYPGESQYPSDTLYPRELTFYPEDTVFAGEAILASDSIYPSNVPYPSELKRETQVEYIRAEKGIVYASIDGVETTLGNGSLGIFSAYDTIYASKDVVLEVEYSSNVYDVDSLEFLQGKATTTNQFKVLKDGSIEAHNGYFSGRIEADSGYFKGEMSAECITSGTLSASRIDAVGLVNTDIFKSTYATVASLSAVQALVNSIYADYASIGELNAQIARINTIESNYITASAVKADYMEVANWTSAGYIKASKIQAETILGCLTGREVFCGSVIAGVVKVDGLYKYDSSQGTYTAIKYQDVTINGKSYTILTL